MRNERFVGPSLLRSFSSSAMAARLCERVFGFGEVVKRAQRDGRARLWTSRQLLPHDEPLVSTVIRRLASRVCRSAGALASARHQSRIAVKSVTPSMEFAKKVSRPSECSWQEWTNAPLPGRCNTADPNSIDVERSAKRRTAASCAVVQWPSPSC